MNGWKLTFGILLMILGIITLSAQVFTTVVSVLFLGWMLIFAGIGEFFYAFFSGSFGRAMLYLIGGIVTFLIGAFIAAFPGASVASITLIIGFYMLAVGLYKTLSSLFVQYAQWGWNFFAGIVTFLLGGMILAQFPTSGLWVIGLFIGVEIFIMGFAMTINSLQPSGYEEMEYQRSAYMTGAKGGKSQREKKDTERKNKSKP